jgi:hypothetical protein
MEFFRLPRWMQGLDFRRNPVVPEPTYTAGPGGPTGEPLTGTVIKLPDERNGLVLVFRVFEKMSYALVMRSTRPIYVGDIVQNP